MSCARLDEASMERAISTTRLPSPSAATIQVFSRMTPPPASRQRTSSRPADYIPSTWDEPRPRHFSSPPNPDVLPRPADIAAGVAGGLLSFRQDRTQGDVDAHHRTGRATRSLANEAGLIDFAIDRACQSRTVPS